MKILIKLSDKREIETEVDEQEFEEIKKELLEGKIKFLSIEGKIIKVSLIESIEPLKERTIPEFSLPEPKMESVDEIMRRKRIKENMDRMWYALQKKGVFEGYKTPDEYRMARRMPLLDKEGNWVYPVKDGNGNWVYPEKNENGKEANFNTSN
jgi:hypothetical protein